MVIDVESCASTRRADSTCGTNRFTGPSESHRARGPHMRSAQREGVWATAFLQMNYYQVFMVSARTSQVRQAVTNRSHNNPVSPSSSAAPNEGAIREETKRLTSRKTHKQTQAGTIRGNSTNTGGVFKSGHAHKHLCTHLSLSLSLTHTHTQQKKVHFISQFSFVLHHILVFL